MITDKQKNFIRKIKERSNYPYEINGLHYMTKSSASKLIDKMLEWEKENNPDSHRNVDIEGDLGLYDG